MTNLTNRDALVVFTHGSSNMAGWQANNSFVVSDDLTPATLDDCYVWGRWNDATNRVSKSAGTHSFENWTTTMNWQQTGLTPAYAIAREYQRRFFETPNSESAVGKPKAVYFINAAFSSLRCTQDTGALAALASFHPGSENVTDTPAFEIIAEGYWTKALQALEADTSIDNIYFDGFYYCGDESAALDAAGAVASVKTKYSVAGGLSDLIAATEFYVGANQRTMPFVGVKPPLQYVANSGVNSTTGAADIADVRAQYDRFLSITRNPATVIDGNDFSLKSAEANPAHYTAQSMLSMGVSMYQARQQLAVGPVLKVRNTRTVVVPINADE